MLTERRDRVSMCSQRNKLKRSPFLRYRSINISASTYIQRVRICNSRPTILCKFHQFYPFFNARNSQLAYRFGLNDSFSVTTTVHTWLTLTSTVFHVLKMSQFSIEISIEEPEGFFVPILKIHRFREIFFFLHRSVRMFLLMGETWQFAGKLFFCVFWAVSWGLALRYSRDW